jgi:hypothetical protein
MRSWNSFGWFMRIMHFLGFAMIGSAGDLAESDYLNPARWVPGLLHDRRGPV